MWVSAHEGGLSVSLARLLSVTCPSPSQGALRMAGGAAAEKEGFGASHTSFYTSAKAPLLGKFSIQ